MAVAFGGKMYVFGGILEVTKELNDLLVYDFKTQKMAVVDKHGDPNVIQNFNKIEDGGPAKLVENNSPHTRTKNYGASPTRKGGNASPSKRATMGAGSPSSSMLARSPTKKPSMLGTSAQTTSQDEKGLSSPTSISMQNSFIIKNADESFDLYY